MMVTAVGLSSYNLALFHLINHAFYKGLLFLGAGAIIHSVGDNQDFRKYGGLRYLLPLTYSVMLIGSLSLMAFPFMTGFYSKDFILESSFGQYSFSSVTVYIIALIGAIFTSLYSIKVLYLIFLNKPNGSTIYYSNLDNLKFNSVNIIAEDSNIYMTLPLIILSLFSIFFGYFTKDIFIGLGSNFFSDNSIFIHPKHEIFINTEFSLPVIIKLLPLICTIFFSFLGLYISEFKIKKLIQFKLSIIGYNIFGFFNQRFFIELFYNKYITSFILNIGGLTVKLLDKGCVELIGPYGFEKLFIKLSKIIGKKLNLSFVTDYALYIILVIIFIIYLFLFREILI
jgi:NADH-ubiquinone oxidoreductase chain 5